MSRAHPETRPPTADGVLHLSAVLEEDPQTAYHRRFIILYGKAKGYPYVSALLHGELFAWAEGVTSWDNRCRLADAEELEAVFERLQEIEDGS